MIATSASFEVPPCDATNPNSSPLDNVLAWFRACQADAVRCSLVEDGPVTRRRAIAAVSFPPPASPVEVNTSDDVGVRRIHAGRFFSSNMMTSGHKSVFDRCFAVTNYSGRNSLVKPCLLFLRKSISIQAQPVYRYHRHLSRKEWLPFA